MFEFLRSLFKKDQKPDTGAQPSVTFKMTTSASFSVSESENEYATAAAVKNSPKTGHPNDNLNYLHFEGTGVFKQTGRSRKVKADAFDETEAKKEIVMDGFDYDSIDIHVADPKPPTEGQVEAMAKHNDYIPPHISSVDASYLIDRYMNDDPEPDPRLLEYATSRKIKLSYYIGRKALHDKIWKNLTPPEKFAFFLCCVSADDTGDWRFDRWDEFLEKGKQLEEDPKFMKSFKEHYSMGFFNGFGQGRYHQRSCYIIAKSLL